MWLNWVHTLNISALNLMIAAQARGSTSLKSPMFMKNVWILKVPCCLLRLPCYMVPCRTVDCYSLNSSSINPLTVHKIRFVLKILAQKHQLVDLTTSSWNWWRSVRRASSQAAAGEQASFNFLRQTAWRSLEICTFWID